MPNPDNPDEHECRRCHDSGYLLDGSLCYCVGGRTSEAIQRKE